jgi:hypothetical protein
MINERSGASGEMTLAGETEVLREISYEQTWD